MLGEIDTRILKNCIKLAHSHFIVCTINTYKEFYEPIKTKETIPYLEEWLVQINKLTKNDWYMDKCARRIVVNHFLIEDSYQLLKTNVHYLIDEVAQCDSVGKNKCTILKDRLYIIKPNSLGKYTDFVESIYDGTIKFVNIKKDDIPKYFN